MTIMGTQDYQLNILRRYRYYCINVLKGIHSIAGQVGISIAVRLIKFIVPIRL